MAAAARTSERVTGAEEGTEELKRGAASFASLFGVPESRSATQPSAVTFGAMRDAASALTRSTGEIGREWTGLMQEGFRINLEAVGAMARTRSLADLMAVQADLVRANLQQTSRVMHHFAAASTRLANETDAALTPLTTPARET